MAHERRHLDGTFDRAGGHREHARSVLQQLVADLPMRVRPVRTGLVASGLGGIALLLSGDPGLAAGVATGL